MLSSPTLFALTPRRAIESSNHAWHTAPSTLHEDPDLGAHTYLVDDPYFLLAYLSPAVVVYRLLVILFGSLQVC